MKNFLMVVAFIAFVLAGAWGYMGGFSNLQVEEKEMGPYDVAYVDHLGAYEDVGPAMDEVYQMLKKAGITQEAGIGIYFDDPEKVAAEQLRSQLGSVINKDDVAKIKDLGLSYQTQTIAKAENIVVVFPYKNKFSYMVGAMKIYPLITSYITEKGYKIENPMIELYDMKENKIYYMVTK